MTIRTRGARASVAWQRVSGVLFVLVMSLVVGCTPTPGDGYATESLLRPRLQARLDNTFHAELRPCATASPRTDAELVAQLNAAAADAPGQLAGQVVDAFSGAVVWTQNADLPLTTASIMKLLTGLAAVSIMGSERTFSTRVVLDPDGTLVLVGGGDPMLVSSAETRLYGVAQPGSLQSLALETAAELLARDVSSVTLDWDESLFGEPEPNPLWFGVRAWSLMVLPSSSLWVDKQLDRGSYNSYPGYDSAEATSVFAQYLRDAGITVSWTYQRRVASAEAELLSSIESLSVGELVGVMLQYSDNSYAELLARQTALAMGNAPTVAGVDQTLTDWLVRHSLFRAGTMILDASGMATEGKVAPEVFTATIEWAVTSRSRALHAVLLSLPTAGSGTLTHRFVDDPDVVGRLRAKSGTHGDATGEVSSLSGYVEDSGGRLLAFAFIINHSDETSDDTALAVEAVVGVLASCGS
jgi:D-alanyl-D-alanine carboxypeptidase/D-alanyl-D-alanine-endopeptidase (penicillin-binding protein 4)